MLPTILKLSEHLGANVDRSVKRHLSFRSVVIAFNNYLHPPRTTPYAHVCQIGDPVLRTHAEPVKPETIRSPEFQRVVKHLTVVMKTYNAMGLSANQIGLSYQIFAVELTKAHLADLGEEFAKSRQVELVPLKVFINPKMKVLDYGKVRDGENCLSFIGYQAVVPRVKSVEIEALDVTGKPFVFKAYGWTARIIQHEMDHLQGKTYVDRMDPDTLECIYWSQINARRGDMSLKYFPKHWLRRFFPF